MSESAVLLARLREHVKGCSRCKPERAIYCKRIEGDAGRFAELRYDEVMAVRMARVTGAREPARA